MRLKDVMSNFGMEDLSHLPPDDEILEEIRKILATADLMKVSKKTVKQELERRFDVNLDAKRPYINSGKSTLSPHFNGTQLTDMQPPKPSYREFFDHHAIPFSVFGPSKVWT